MEAAIITHRPGERRKLSSSAAWILSMRMETSHWLPSVSCFHQRPFMQTLTFHPQTKVGAFQDTFSVSLAWIKCEVLLCIYVICNEHQMTRNIWRVLKTNKKFRKYLPATISGLFNLFNQFRISDSFPSRFKWLYSEQQCHPYFKCLNSTEQSSSLFKQIWRISCDLKSPTNFSCSSFFLKPFSPCSSFFLNPFSPSLSYFHANIIKSQLLKNHSHDRSWITEVNTNLSPCFRRKSWRMKTRNATQQKIVDRTMVAWTAWIDWYSAKTKKQPWLKIQFLSRPVQQWAVSCQHFSRRTLLRVALLTFLGT